MSLYGCAYFQLKQYKLSSQYLSKVNKKGVTSLYMRINHFALADYEETICFVKTYL